MVGDCTDVDVMDLLFSNTSERATLWFTDPPYGIEVAGKNRELNKYQPANRNTDDIEGDSAIIDVDSWRDLLERAFGLAYDYLEDNCAVFICAPQGGLLRIVMEVLQETGLETRHIINWVKNQPTFSLGRLDYDYQHEPILFTWKKTHKRLKAGTFRTSIWEVDKPRASANHPVIKPVELPGNAILNHTEHGDIVLDNFLGTGTTMAACQALGRTCYAVELEPKWAAVCINRLSTLIPTEPREVSGSLERATNV